MRSSVVKIGAERRKMEDHGAMPLTPSTGSTAPGQSTPDAQEGKRLTWQRRRGHTHFYARGGT
jgi:hypothetical protein